MATPPPPKKAKSQCHFLSKWIVDYPGIGKSSKGNNENVDRHITTYKQHINDNR